jgi:hypothetical protein
MGLAHETEHALTGHNDVTMPTPNGFALSSAWWQVRLHAWALSALFVVLTAILWRRAGLGAWWRRNGWQLIVLLFAVVWAVTLSYNTIPFHRYALPIIVLVYFLAALGAAAMVQLVLARSRPASLLARVGIVAVIVMLQLPVCLDFNHQYADDSRQRLKDWILAHVHPGAMIAGDRYAQLYSPPDPRSPNAGRPFPYRQMFFEQVSKPWFVFGPGNLLEDVRRAGVRYVAISEPSYERYISRFTKAEPGSQTEFDRKRKFYLALLKEHTPIWQSESDHPNGSFVNPRIRLYDLSQEPAASPATRPSK